MRISDWSSDVCSSDLHTRAGDPCGARAADDDMGRPERAAGAIERLEQRRRHDDGGAVLVVVQDGDSHDRLEALIDLEAVGRADILAVDRAARRFERATERPETVNNLKSQQRRKGKNR